MDFDWAGDLLGRTITTGVIVRRGKHLLRHISCFQTLVALSSGEAEYYALIRGACTSLGIQSHYQDLMIDVPNKSTVTVQQQGVSQEDVELEDV